MSVSSALLLLLPLSLFRISFAQDIIEIKYELKEEPDIGTFVGNVVGDSELSVIYSREVLAVLHLRFLKQRISNVFLLDGSTGMLRTANRLDRESLCPGVDSCILRIDVAIQPIQYFRIIRVTVNLLDVNDNSPRFYDSTATLDVLETVAVGSGFAVPTAYDPDSPPFSVQRYQIDAHQDAFNLRQTQRRNESTQLRLVVVQPLDRELIDIYHLTITAYDGGDPPRSDSMNVVIKIIDVNDNSPVFEEDTYRAIIKENSPLLTSIIRVQATDADVGLNGEVVYGLTSLTASSLGHLFAVQNTTGQLYVNGQIDYEESEIYHLAIIARDLGPDSIPKTVLVLIQVLDVNDNEPEITVDTLSSTPGIAEVYESGTTGMFVAHVSVVDKDTGNKNGQFNCSLEDNYFHLKKIDATEFHVVTTQVLDREDQSEHSLAIVCRDFGDESQTSVEHLTVKVLDINDHDPIFQTTSYYGEAIENNYIGMVVFYVNATDADAGPNAEINFDAEGEGASAFQINPLTGAVQALVSFDRELIQQVKFRIIARDSGNPIRSSTAVALVNVIDVNDEKPRFPKDVYYFQVQENELHGTRVGSVKAEDLDSGLYGQVIYSIMSGSFSEMFSIDDHTGFITTDQALDRETQAVHDLIVVATDAGSPPFTGSVSVLIFVADRNDNRPQFDQSLRTNKIYYLSTSSSQGYVVTRVTATDADSGNNATIVYTILYENEATRLFSIDQDSGDIFVKSSLINMDGELHELKVMAKDCGVPILSSQISIFVAINSSLPMTPSHAMSGYSQAIVIRYNLTIVVVLSVISGIITMCLITAIIFIRQQDCKQENPCGSRRMETTKIKTRVSTSHCGQNASEDLVVSKHLERVLKKEGEVIGRNATKNFASVGGHLIILSNI